MTTQTSRAGTKLILSTTTYILFSGHDVRFLIVTFFSPQALHRQKCSCFAAFYYSIARPLRENIICEYLAANIERMPSNEVLRTLHIIVKKSSIICTFHHVFSVMQHPTTQICYIQLTRLHRKVAHTVAHTISTILNID